MSSQHSSKNVNHTLHRLLESRKIAEASILVESILEDLTFTGKEKRGFISLVIKLYIMNSDNDKLDSFYQIHKDNLMKRDILLYCQYYYLSDHVKSTKNFVYLISNYYLDSSNLLFLIKNKMFDFIKILNGFYIKLTDFSSLEIIDNYEMLEKYTFKTEIIEHILSQVKISKKSDLMFFYKNLEEIDNRKIIIDAGNILFSFGGEVTISGYKLLLELVEYFFDKEIIPIIIIHNRHLKTHYKGKLKEKNIVDSINSLRKFGSNFIFETPYNENDDFYIIYLSLILQSKILTNDNYKDHIFNFRTNEVSSEENMAQNYIDDLVVKYSIEGGTFIINNIDSQEISKCIQIIGNDFYLPTIENTFVKVSIKECLSQ